METVSYTSVTSKSIVELTIDTPSDSFSFFIDESEASILITDLKAAFPNLNAKPTVEPITREFATVAQMRYTTAFANLITAIFAHGEARSGANRKDSLGAWDEVEKALDTYVKAAVDLPSTGL